MGLPYAKLRKKHPRFIFQSYSLLQEKDSLGIQLKFQTEPNLSFSPLIRIKNYPQNPQPHLNLLKNLAFHLGLMEIFTYWKATCSPEIVIEAGSLSQKQLRWWKKFFTNGLGQFYYTNKIDFRAKDFLKITTHSSSPVFKSLSWPADSGRALVPVGGGKESALALEIVKKAGLKVIPYIFITLTPLRSALDLVKTFGPTTPIIIHRPIDPLLLELNKKGYLNGHVPIIACISFASLLAAFLSGGGKIVFGNERSADEGNVEYLGKTINHQYDKSGEFEKIFRDYIKENISPTFSYFSLLRPLYELQIAKLFSRYRQYFPIFHGCNVGQKTNTWCDQCPKCLFVFTALYPFVQKRQIVQIFGRDLFQNKTLISPAKEMIGLKKFKPFECVGAYEESKIAFWLSLKEAENQRTPLPVLLRWFKAEIVPKEKGWPQKANQLLNSWNPNHNLPKDLEIILKKELANV